MKKTLLLFFVLVSIGAGAQNNTPYFGNYNNTIAYVNRPPIFNIDDKFPYLHVAEPYASALKYEPRFYLTESEQIRLKEVWYSSIFADSDTANALNVQVQAQDWAYIFGSMPDIVPDSATAYQVRRVANKIKNINPTIWTQNVLVDTLYGRLYMFSYKVTKTAPAAEIAPRYTAIINQLDAKTNMNIYTAPFNLILIADFNRKRDRGKTIVMDQ